PLGQDPFVHRPSGYSIDVYMTH
ncbi:MAG: hypothetical protein QOH83_2558, partial [Solirubrobacteraceae bacterium]|nr:hypothetical protein [Solirubrobacteraceae bacterium]